MENILHIATYSERAIEVIKENHLGIELNDLCISEMLDEDKVQETIRMMEQEIKDSYAESVLIHGPFTEIVPASIDHRMVDLGLERLNEAYDVCRILGVKKMIVHSGYLPPLYFKNWHIDRSVEFWKRFMSDKADDFNLCIENVLEDEPFMLKELIERLNDKRISLCIDIGHANWSNNGKYSVAEWIKILGKDIGHFHLHNNYGSKDNHNEIHDGQMDMIEIMETIGNYCREDITMTIESHICEESAKWLKQYIEKH